MDPEKRPEVGATVVPTGPFEVGDDLKKPDVLETKTSSFDLEDKQDGEVIIKTAKDAATHLLPMRDDFDPALTFRSIFLATGLAAFQAVMYQIYMVSLHSMLGMSEPGLIVAVVQTYLDHYSRYIHCHHCFLPR